LAYSAAVLQVEDVDEVGGAVERGFVDAALALGGDDQPFAFLLHSLGFADVAEIDRDTLGCGECRHVVPRVAPCVERRERRLPAFDHRAPVSVLEIGALHAGVRLPEDLSAQIARCTFQDAVRLGIDISEPPLAIQGEEPFADTVEDAHGILAGGDGGVVDRVENELDTPVRGEHGRIDRQPMALFEPAIHRMHVVTRGRHGVRRTRGDDALQRLRQRCAPWESNAGLSGNTSNRGRPKIDSSVCVVCR
jgi:hypothetical protein